MKDWQSFEALEETIRRDTVRVAAALHQSESLICKWKEPPSTPDDFQQSGARNPLDRIELIIQTIEKTDPARAYVPIYWLCDRFGLARPFRLPEAKSADDLNRALLKWTKEFGETCEAVSKTLEDGRVKKAELKKVFKELMEGTQAGLALYQLLQEKAGEGKD